KAVSGKAADRQGRPGAHRPCRYRYPYAHLLHSLLHIDSRGIGANRLKLALDFLDREPECRIAGDAPHDQVVCVNHRRMVTPKMLADRRKRAVGPPAAQIHRYLTAKRDVLGAL